MQPWLTAYFFEFGHSCYVSYDQLTPAITRCLVTSITRPYRNLKFMAYQGDMFFWSWPLTKYRFFNWIAGSCQVNLLQSGTHFSKVPKSFRTRKAVAKPQTFWLQTCCIHILRCFLRTRSFRRIHLSVFRCRLTKMALLARKVSGTFEKRAPGPGCSEAG